MKKPSSYLDALISELSALPGIGNKSAGRIAFHILKISDADAERLAKTIVEIKKNIRTCNVCGGLSDGNTCLICSDIKRDNKTICVVAEARELLAIEATGEYNGGYHVLGGLISPLDGIGPDELNIGKLVTRISESEINEIILALNPTVEGDATSLYIGRLLGGSSVKITRIARGLPVGSDIEYADSATLIKSIENRVEF